MWKPLRVMPLGMVLAGWCITASAWTDSIVELTPSSVVAIDQAEPLGKLPVVSAVACDPHKGLLVTVGDDHLVRIGHLAHGTPLQGLRESGDSLPTKRLSVHEDWVRSAVLSPSGAMLATAGFDARIVLWDTVAGEPIRQLPEPGNGPRTLAFSPDGRTLAAAGFDGQVRLYDTLSAQPARLLEAPGSDIRAVAFSPDGRRLAAAGRLGVVRIWDLASGNVVGELDGHQRRICALAYSPGGEKIVAAGEGPDILIWDTAEGTLTATLTARPGKIMAIAFCGPNRLAAGDSCNTIRLWNLTSGRQELRLVGHTGSVASLAWDAEAGVLISGSFDTTVRTWQLTGRTINTISQR